MELSTEHFDRVWGDVILVLMKTDIFKKKIRPTLLSITVSAFLTIFVVSLTAYGASTISSNIATGGTLSVTGLSTLAGFISTASSTVTSTLYVGDAFTASSTLQGTGAAIFYSTLRADGLSTLAGFISTASSSVSTGGLAVTGALSASTSLSVGTGGNASVLTGLVAGFCTIPSTSITASTSGMGALAATCSGATGVRSGDRIFLTATSSLIENNFVLLSASSTSNDTIQVMIGETSTSTSGLLSTGIHSFNFWAVR